MIRADRRWSLTLGVVCTALFACTESTDPVAPDGNLFDPVIAAKGGGGGKPGGETAGNNLSYPVIWAEGASKVLPGTAGVAPILAGEWWYQWGMNGTDPDVTPASCLPDPDDPGFAGLLCDDGIAGTVDPTLVAGTPAADNPMPLARVFLQKDAYNEWQAQSWPFPAARPAGPVIVDRIDWGDNLESVDWTTVSQVRTEVVLFEADYDAVGPVGDAETYGWPMTEYEMRHVSGWGIDEVHGLATDLTGTPLMGPGTWATVYSACARLTIQRLLIDRDDAEIADLVWEPEQGWTEPVGYTEDLINPPIFNMPVYTAGDGPGYYSAEINVKGRIIYGYTWNVRKLNEGAGDYRLTFSFDQVCGTAGSLNTFFDATYTELLLPIEVVTASSDSDGGAIPELDFTNNLTFIDIHIIAKGGGGGGGRGGGGGGGGRGGA